MARARGPKLSLVLFSQELLALLNAGLGIVEGLEALLEKEANPAARGVLERLLAGLREGQRFSSVLAAQPALFPPLYVGIVRAAEGTSDLPRALSRYIDYQQRIDTVRSKIVSASIYPVILLCVGGGVSSFLIGYVVPRFAEVYQGAGRNLPWMSQLLLEWGQFAAGHGSAILLCAAALVALAVFGIRRLLRSGGIARLLARLPGIGERARIYELSRLYLTLGMLTEGGITIVGAIETVQPMVSTTLGAALANARAAIESGRPLSSAFEANGLTTPISLRMLRVGERTGDMGPMLTQSAAFYDGEISRWIDRFTRTFEPLLMAAIGLVVGAIVVLLYMPIFDLAGDMS
jgi:general secretion pathway protein F